MSERSQDGNSTQTPKRQFWVFSRNQYAIQVLSHLALGFAAGYCVCLAFPQTPNGGGDDCEWRILRDVPMNLEEVRASSPEAAPLELAILCLQADFTRQYLLKSLNRNPAYQRIDEPTVLQKAALAEFRRASSGYDEYRELLHLQYPDSVQLTWILEREEN